MGKLAEEIKSIPWWGWIVFGLVLVGAIMALRKGSQSGSGTTAATGALAGSAGRSTDLTPVINGGAAGAGTTGFDMATQFAGIEQQVSQLEQNSQSHYIYTLGTNKTTGGFGIWQWANGAWQQITGGATSILGTDQNGVLWVANDIGQIWSYNPLTKAWTLEPGQAPTPKQLQTA